MKDFSRLVEGAKFNWQTIGNNGRALGAALLLVSQLRKGGLTRGYVGITFQFAKRVVALQRHGSWTYVVRYLKACSVLLQQASNGQRITAVQELGVAVARTRRGLPRIVHPLSRKRIRGGSHWEVRFWLSLFGLYRVIDMPGKLKLETISRGPTVTVGFLREWVLWLANFAPVILDQVGYTKHANRWTRYRCRSPVTTGETLVFCGKILADFIEILTALVYPNDWAGLPLDLKPRFRMFTTSGPGSANSQVTAGAPPRSNLANLITDAILIQSDGDVGPAFQKWLCLVEDDYLTSIFTEVNSVWDEVIGHPDEDPEAPGFRTYRRAGELRDPVTGGFKYPPSVRPLLGFGNRFGIGKLGFKAEAAGKIRVFAMVDSLTQMLLGPLHDALFNMLRKIPQDGTFDQIKPAEALLQRGLRSFWSYDLSAATDRFPVSLQQAVLGIIIGPKLARLWVSILDRTFRVPQYVPPLHKGDRPVKVPKGTPTRIKYGAGQPMGALTSWAVFSLTHHILVQYAAFKAFGTYSWFSDYALLGDDIVIANKIVAEKYLALLRSIGVEFGLAKSLISSTGGFEFAKRTYRNGQDVSGLPLLAVGSAKADPSVLEELLVRSEARGFKEALLVAARFLGYGYRTRARLPVVFESRTRLQGLAIILSRPNGPFGEASFTNWITKSNCGKPVIVSDQAMATVRESLWSRLWDPLIKSFDRLMAILFTWADRTAVRAEPTVGYDAWGDPVRLDRGVGRYTEFIMTRIFEPYIDTVFKDVEELMGIIEELRPLAGREGHIDDAWRMLKDATERVSALPKGISISDKPRMEFGAKRRSAAVRTWRALHTLLQKLEAMEDKV